LLKNLKKPIKMLLIPLFILATKQTEKEIIICLAAIVITDHPSR
jgi:hypothetical protein